MKTDRATAETGRVLLVTSRFPAKGEEFLEAELRELNKILKVEVCPVRPLRARPPRQQGPAPTRREKRPVLSRKHLRASPGVLARNAIVVPKGIALGNPDLNYTHVHSYWSSTPATVGMIAADRAGIPFSFTAHRGDIAAENLLDLKVRRASFVRVISDAGLRWMQSYATHADADKIKVVKIGVDIPDDPTARGDGSRLELLAVGNLLPVKGHSFLIDACAELSKRLDVHCTIVGEGSEGEDLRRRVDELGLSDRFTFTGRLPHAEVLSMFASDRYSMLVHPSTEAGTQHEGLPVVLLEAAARGLPIVATASGATGEFVEDGVTGALVPHSDAGALARAVERTMEPAYARRTSETALERVRKNHDARVQMESLAALILNETA